MQMIQPVNLEDRIAFAGIGSRETPSDVLDEMRVYSSILLCNNYILRSGGADGADSAFADGHWFETKGFHQKEIYNPQGPIIAGNDPAARAIAQATHPAWNALSPYAKQLMTRNVNIILGYELNDPVKFVICWDNPNKKYGGTKFGIKLAKDRNIPVYNMAIDNDYKQLVNEMLELYNYLPDDVKSFLNSVHYNEIPEFLTKNYKPLKKRLK